MLRRQASGVVAGFLAGLAVPRARAQPSDWPIRQVTLVVPYPPGGATDLVARVLQQHLRDALGQSVVVENRGGGGSIGTAQVARARPDGHTLLLTSNPPLVMNLFVMRNLPYQTARDLTGITLIGETYMCLVVNRASPFRTVADIVAEARRRPGELSYGTAGFASGHHLAGEQLAANAGIRLNHIPFQGGAPAVQAALGGQLDMSFGTLPAVLPFVQRGDLRLVALAEPRRYRELPDAPTIAETVPGVETTTWLGLVAPAGTRPEILDRLHTLVGEAVAAPGAGATLAAAGFVPVMQGPAAFNTRIAADLRFWEGVIARIGLRAE